MAYLALSGISLFSIQPRPSHATALHVVFSFNGSNIHASPSLLKTRLKYLKVNGHEVEACYKKKRKRGMKKKEEEEEEGKEKKARYGPGI